MSNMIHFISPCICSLWFLWRRDLKKNIAPFQTPCSFSEKKWKERCMFVPSFCGPRFLQMFSGRSEVAKSFPKVLVKPPNFEHVIESKSHLRLRPQNGFLHHRSAAIARNKHGNLRVPRYPPPMPHFPKEIKPY